MRTIVAASDLTERSEAALARAMSLAAAQGARLIAMTVSQGADEPAAERALRASLACLDGAARVDWSAEVHRGDPAEAVTAAAASAQADLLVLGLHRIRALDSLRRTTMERILAGVPCPVLLAHRPAAGPYARILVLTAFAPACAAALRAARRLAPGAALQVLHALDVPLRDRLNPDRAAAEAEAAAARWAGALPLDVPAPLIVPGNLHEVLDIVFEDFRPDLLAVGAASRADDTMPGHWVRDLIRAPRADLLVAPSSLAAAPDRPPASGP